MKVALIRKEYTLSWGGAESYVVHLSRYLAERGTYCSCLRQHLGYSQLIHAITFHRIPMIDFYSPFKKPHLSRLQH